MVLTMIGILLFKQIIFILLFCFRAAIDFAKILKKKLENRVGKCGTGNLLLCVSHYLDPYSHGVILKKFGVFEQTKEEMKDLWNDVIPERNNNNASATVQNTDDDNDLDPIEKLLKLDDVQNARAPVADVVSPLDLEMRLYESKPRIEKTGDRLAWWRQQKELKLLRVIAQEVLSVPISSAKSERVFSTSGRVSYLIITQQLKLFILF